MAAGFAGIGAADEAAEDDRNRSQNDYSLHHRLACCWIIDMGICAPAYKARQIRTATVRQGDAPGGEHAALFARARTVLGRKKANQRERLLRQPTVLIAFRQPAVSHAVVTDPRAAWRFSLRPCTRPLSPAHPVRVRVPTLGRHQL